MSAPTLEQKRAFPYQPEFPGHGDPEDTLEYQAMVRRSSARTGIPCTEPKKQNAFAPTNHDAGKRTLLELTRAGYWFCSNCNGPRDIVVSDQGQPNKCASCGSPRVKLMASIAL